MKPTISVIIPSYNYGRFLVRAIESVLSQSYQNFEIIVADDHSTDNTSDIMKGYTEKYRDIKWIRHPKNIGQSANRNSALAVARGEFIAMLDADDWFHHDYLANAIKPFENKRVGVVYTANMFHHEDGSTKQPPQKVINGMIWQELYINNFIGTAVVFRKAAMPAHGYEEQLIPELNNMGVDWWILLEMSVNHEFVGIDKPLYNYSYHSNQISSKYHNRVLADVFIQWKFRNQYGVLLSDDVKKEAAYWSAIRTGYYLREEGEKINACKAYKDAVIIHPFSLLPYKGILSTFVSLGVT